MAGQVKPAIRCQQSKNTCVGWSPRSRAPSNLHTFLAYTSPFVPVQQDSAMGGTTEGSLYFDLRDLWQRYEEWSAYGAEVPINVAPLRQGEQQVTQYYAPSLSALQVFAKQPRPQRQRPPCSPRADVDSDNDSFDESSSDDSSVSSAADSEPDTCVKAVPRSTSDHCSVLRKQKSIGEPSTVLCQYFEDCSPYERLPLFDKIQELASGDDGFADLVSLRSCDIHPSSWYAVAWYPIYHVPAGRTIRDLGACFLTYHSLTLGEEHGAHLSPEMSGSRPCQLPSPAVSAVLAHRHQETEEQLDGSDLALLHPFAFAPYRMQGRLWLENEHDSASSRSMLAASGLWVQRRQVVHNDLDFFMRRTSQKMWRR